MDILKEERIRDGGDSAVTEEQKYQENIPNPEGYNTRNKEKEGETITPDKKDYKEGSFTGIESLRSKSRRPVNTFKRREALNKGWTADSSQMTLDKFLVPKRKSKADNNKFMMMSCSDSYS